MRPSLRVLTVLPLLVPLGVRPAAASGCVASTAPPTAQHSFGANAFGEYTCDGPRPELSVRVCIEALDTTGWEPVACDTADATGVAQVRAETYGCWYGLWLIRAVAVGTASTGEHGWSASTPVPYYCTPLAVRAGG